MPLCEWILIVEATGGIPMIISEAIHYLQERHFDPLKDNLKLPMTHREIVLENIRSRGNAMQRLLAIASFLPTEFTADLLLSLHKIVHVQEKVIFCNWKEARIIFECKDGVFKVEVKNHTPQADKSQGEQNTLSEAVRFQYLSEKNRGNGKVYSFEQLSLRSYLRNHFSIEQKKLIHDAIGNELKRKWTW